MAGRMLVAMQPLPEHPDFTPAMLLAVRADEVRDAMGLVEASLRERAAQFTTNGWEVDEAFSAAAEAERFDVIHPPVGPVIIIGKLRLTRA